MMKCKVQTVHEVNARKVLYVCDRKRCAPCTNDFCEYTTDINHAANFYWDEKSELWIERAGMVALCEIDEM